MDARILWNPPCTQYRTLGEIPTFTWELLEYKVEMIIADRRKKGRKGRFVMEYLTQFKGYNANLDKWLNLKQLKNAPEYS